MSNNPISGFPDVWGGRSRATIVEHTGPVSYAPGGDVLTQSVYGGPNVLGLSGFYFVSTGITYSGTYFVAVLYGGKGVRQKITLRWSYLGSGQGVDGVNGTGGTGMTVGTVPLVFTGGGGTGAAGTLTVLTATTFSIQITSPGSGYNSIPTVTAATGGTPPTLTATVGSNAGGEVAAGVNLSGETVRLMALGG